MKKISDWKKFNEDYKTSVNQPNWTSTSTDDTVQPMKDSGDAELVNKPEEVVQTPIEKLEPISNEHVYIAKIPVTAELDTSKIENIISNYSYNINALCSQLNNEGIDAWWLDDAIKNFKRQYEMNEPEEEPSRDDFEEGEGGDADYESEMDEFNDKKTEFEELPQDDSDWFDKYIAEEWNGKWDKFLEEFSSRGPVNDVINRHYIHNVFDNLSEDFNEATLEKYCDEVEGIISLRVTEDEFDDEGRFWVEIKADHELTDDEIEKVGSYLEGQCSDGWGEGFEQHECEGYFIHTWSHENDYEIEIDKK